MKFSDLTVEQQNRVLLSLVNSLYSRGRELMIDLAFHVTGDHSGYGVDVMSHADKLNNRLMADLIIRDNGIPNHDTEALKWLSEVLE